jgi:hypothetical protein
MSERECWNFASRGLRAEIASSAVAQDGHDADALLLTHHRPAASTVLLASAAPRPFATTSTTSSAASSSFICANFVRTPVSLTLTFPHEVRRVPFILFIFK